MAVLSKHGVKLCELTQLTKKIAYMSDGKILANRGDGWKLWRRVKDGVNIEQHAAQAEQRYAQLLIDRPMFAAYREALHSAVSFSQRYLVNECLNMLANDPDGVWSELNDMAGIAIDIDECVELCRLHDAAANERKQQLTAVTNAARADSGETGGL